MQKLSFVLAATAFAAAPALAQEAPDRPLVTVTGVGEASRPPDFMRIGFAVRGEGATPAEALASASRQRAQMEASVHALRGLEKAPITTGQFSNADVRAQGCSSSPYAPANQLSQGACAVVGAIATLEMEVKVSPAERGGHVASLLTQLGAKSVSLRGSGVADEDALNSEAALKAVADAQERAARVARAAGGRLGPVWRIQDGGSPYEVVVTGSRAAAPPPPPPLPVPPVAGVPLAVAMPFAPQPVTRTARVTVVYQLIGGQ